MDHQSSRRREERVRNYEKDKHRGDKNRKHRHKEKKPHKPKKSSESIELTEPRDYREQFMFVYEDSEGTLYANIKSIKANDGDLVNIFPVYFQWGNDNLEAETIKREGGKWTTTLEENPDSSWLQVINGDSSKYNIHIFEGNEIVVYNGKFFFNDGALFLWIETLGAEVLPVTGT